MALGCCRQVSASTSLVMPCRVSNDSPDAERLHRVWHLIPHSSLRPARAAIKRKVRKDQLSLQLLLTPKANRLTPEMRFCQNSDCQRRAIVRKRALSSSPVLNREQTSLRWKRSSARSPESDTAATMREER